MALGEEEVVGDVEEVASFNELMCEVDALAMDVVDAEAVAHGMRRPNEELSGVIHYARLTGGDDHHHLYPSLALLVPAANRC
jgi:hypothetical protein